MGESEFLGTDFYRIMIIPSKDPSKDIILAATNNGLFMSENGGEEWSEIVTNMKVTDIIMDATESGNIVIYFAFPESYIKITGTTINSISRLSKFIYKDDNSKDSIITLDISQSDPPTLYALFKKLDGSDEFYVKEQNGIWTLIENMPTEPPGKDEYSIFVKSTLSNIDSVYLRRRQLWKAERQKENARKWNFSKVDSFISHDCNTMAFDLTNVDVVYSGNGTGIYISYDGGYKWDDKINKGLCISNITSMDKHPTSNTIALIENRFHGTQQYRNCPVFYHCSDVGGGHCGIDQKNPDTYLHAYIDNYNNTLVERSDEGGKFESWYSISNGLPGSSKYPPLSIEPISIHSRNVVVGINNKIYISDMDGTGDWNTIELVDMNSDHISTIKYADSDLIYVLYAGTNNGEVYKIQYINQKLTAVKISNSQFPSSNISDILVMGTNPNTIIVVMTGSNTGNIWQGDLNNDNYEWKNISSNIPNIPCNTIVADPYKGTYYVGTDNGIFFTEKDEINWKLLGGNLPNVPISDLQILLAEQEHRFLRVATRGRGIWETNITFSLGVI